MSLMFFSNVSINICSSSSSLQSNWLLRIECVIKTLYAVTKSAGMCFWYCLVYLFSGSFWHIDSSGVKDSNSAYTINGICTDLLFLKDIFDPSSGSSIFIASYELQYAMLWDASHSFQLKILKHRKHTYLAWPFFWCLQR